MNVEPCVIRRANNVGLIRIGNAHGNVHAGRERYGQLNHTAVRRAGRQQDLARWVEILQLKGSVGRRSGLTQHVEPAVAGLKKPPEPPPWSLQFRIFDGPGLSTILRPQEAHLAPETRERLVITLERVRTGILAARHDTPGDWKQNLAVAQRLHTVRYLTGHSGIPILPQDARR